MKRILFLAVLIVSCSGCASSNFRPFYSPAGIPSVSTITESDLRFVVLEGEILVNDKLGIFCGIENGTIPYVLIAPKQPNGGGATSTPYYYYNFNHAAALSISQVKEFISVLDDSTLLWGKKYAIEDARYLEFSITQEHKREQVSEHVVLSDSSLRYWCQVNSLGATSLIILGEGPSEVSVEFTIEELEKFKSRLEKSLSELDSMSR